MAQKHSLRHLFKKELLRKEKKKLNFIVKIIIGEKLIKGTILLLLSISFFPIFSDQIEGLLYHIARRTSLLSNAHYITRAILNFEAMSDKRLLIFSSFFFLWGIIELTEGIGLFQKRRWAEYLTVVGTGIFIPIELITIFQRFSFEKLILLSFNIFLVIYLILSRRLFNLEDMKNEL